MCKYKKEGVLTPLNLLLYYLILILLISITWYHLPSPTRLLQPFHPSVLIRKTTFVQIPHSSWTIHNTYCRRKKSGQFFIRLRSESITVTHGHSASAKFWITSGLISQTPTVTTTSTMLKLALHVISSFGLSLYTLPWLITNCLLNVP